MTFPGKSNWFEPAFLLWDARGLFQCLASIAEQVFFLLRCPCVIGIEFFLCFLVESGMFESSLCPVWVMELRIPE